MDIENLWHINFCICSLKSLKIFQLFHLLQKIKENKGFHVLFINFSYKRILKNSSTRKYTTKDSLQIIKRSLPMSVRKNLKKTSYIRSKYLRRGEKEVKYPRDSLLSTLLVSFVYLHLKNTIFTVSRDYINFTLLIYFSLLV